MKNNANTRAAFLEPVASTLAPLITVAGPDSKGIIPEVAPVPASPWELRITPYGWLNGLDGTVGAGGFVSELASAGLYTSLNIRFL